MISAVCFWNRGDFYFFLNHHLLSAKLAGCQTFVCSLFFTRQVLRGRLESCSPGRISKPSEQARTAVLPKPRETKAVNPLCPAPPQPWLLGQAICAQGCAGTEASTWHQLPGIQLLSYLLLETTEETGKKNLAKQHTDCFRAVIQNSFKKISGFWIL